MEGYVQRNFDLLHTAIRKESSAQSQKKQEEIRNLIDPMLLQVLCDYTSSLFRRYQKI